VEWLRGTEAADVKRSFGKLSNLLEAGTVGQQDVAVLEALLAGLPAGAGGSAAVEVALAQRRAFGEEFTAKQCALLLSDRNRKWCGGMSRLLEVDGGSSHTWTSCYGRRSYLWRTGGWCCTAAMPAMERLEVQSTQVSVAGPAARPPLHPHRPWGTHVLLR
jgi:hypothetical protein